MMSESDPKISSCAPAHLTDDRCLDLLHGLLDDAEAQAIAAHVATCPPCERLLQVSAAERERVRSRAAAGIVPATTEARDVAAGAGATHSPTDIAPHVAPLWRRVLPWAIAASITIGAGVFAKSSFGPAARLPTAKPAAAWIELPRVGISNREFRANGADADVQRGLEAYERRDVETAIGLLRSAVTSGEMDTVRRVFLASVLALQNRDDSNTEARHLLADVALDDLPEPWRGEALWTQCVLLSRSGEAAAADTLARELAKRDDAVGARARSALATR
jgi:hypothetical protein